MPDLRTEVREAFDKEQSAYSPPPTIRHEVVDAVVGRHKRVSIDGGRQPDFQRMAVAAAILLTVAIVAGLLSVRLAQHQVPGRSIPPTPTLKCQLPVFLTNGNRGDTIHGPNGAGFVSLPGGDFTMYPPGNLSPYFGLTYDWAVHAWLPVGSDAVAPDGLSYVIPNNSTGQWDLADARTHSHRALVATKDWNLRSYQKEGVYLDKQQSNFAWPPGLWLLDPSTGVIRQITSQGIWTDIGDGAAWSFGGYGSPFGKTFRRLDLKSGEVTTWYTSVGATYQTWGRDQVGRPLVALFHPPSSQGYSPVDLYELTAPGQLVKLTSTNGDALVSVPVGDQHGIWFAVGTVIWLYSNGSLQEVATLPGGGAQPAGSAWVQVSGSCSSQPA